MPSSYANSSNSSNSNSNNSNSNSNSSSSKSKSTSNSNIKLFIKTSSNCKTNLTNTEIKHGSTPTPSSHNLPTSTEATHQHRRP